MVSGSPPAGLKVGQQFCYEMRLLASFREEMIVAMPLGSAGNKTSSSSNSSGEGNGVVIIPPTVSLKLQLPLNRTSLKASKEFIRMTERCLHQYGLLSDRIQVRTRQKKTAGRASLSLPSLVGDLKIGTGLTSIPAAGGRAHAVSRMPAHRGQ